MSEVKLVSSGTPTLRALGNTGLQVSEIGFGCSSLGGVLDREGEADSLRTLQMAVDFGINFFDTADAYSLGRSEELLGKAVSGCRDKVLIATKGGSRFTPAWKALVDSRSLLVPFKKMLRPFKRYFNLLRHTQKQYEYTPTHLRRGLEASLKRLATDYIDLYQLYNPTIPVLEEGEFIETLEDFKREGKIRFYGISCRTVEEALLCLNYPGISTVQIPISLADQEGLNGVVDQLAAQGIGIIAREPLAQGFLTASNSGTTMAEQSARSWREIKARKRRAMNFEFLVCPDRSLAQAALQFVLQVQGVSTVIPGMVTPTELEENIGTLSASQLTDHELQGIMEKAHLF